MNKIKEILKNESIKETLSFLMATLFAKGVSYIGFFIIVRILTKTEIGMIELFNSNVNFLLPFASLELHECFLRFTPQSSKDKDKYRSNIFIMLILESIVMILLSLIVKNKLLIYGILSLTFVTYATYFARAENRKILFKLKELLGTILQYSLLFVLIYFGFNYDGYIYAFIISNVIVATIIFIIMRKEVHICLEHVNTKNLKVLCSYAIPLIPNAFGWWIISSSDKWMIQWFVDVESVAVYSVATKFSSLIMMVLNNIYFVVQNRFFLSERNKERDQMCKLYIYVSILISIAGVLIPSFILKVIVGSDYADGVKLFYLYAPTTMYWAFGAFYGIGSQIKKNTMSLTFTMAISAVVNVAINYILIPIIGIEGAIVGSVISLFVWFISRYLINKKVMEVELSFVQILLISIVQIISILHYFYA